MPAVQLGIETLGLEPKLFAGGIGQKLNQIKTFLTDTSSPRRVNVNI